MTHAVRFYAAVAAGVLGVVLAVVLQDRSGGVQAAIERTDAGRVDWCAAGLEPIAGGGCFAPAKRRVPDPTLLVYLHGLYAPESAAEEMERQARVARHATALGYSVLALRGMQGLCTDPRLATNWCWPSNERNAAQASAVVARWGAALDEAAGRTKGTRRVLLGFSNGGYFAALIASRALVRFDAVAIAHAGPVMPMTAAGTKPPVLLVDADDDPSSPELRRLDGELAREGWPHALVIREGGHALLDWDVTMALAFFDRVRVERWPLSPPLGPSRAARPRDAGAPAIAAKADAPDAAAPAAGRRVEPPDASDEDAASE